MSETRAFYVKVIDRHLFLRRRSNHYLVWLGLKEHVETLDDESLHELVEYRLAFDERCCAFVN